jgi:hypothetical protein
MRLQSLHLVNYRSFSDTTLDLSGVRAADGQEAPFDGCDQDRDPDVR